MPVWKVLVTLIVIRLLMMLLVTVGPQSVTQGEAGELPDWLGFIG
ncbi:MAG: hypothetical protein ACI8QT_002176, partial [Halioglobus sp.]